MDVPIVFVQYVNFVALSSNRHVDPLAANKLMSSTLYKRSNITSLINVKGTINANFELHTVVLTSFSDLF